jgi:hypothetical protein
MPVAADEGNFFQAGKHVLVEGGRRPLTQMEIILKDTMLSAILS